MGRIAALVPKFAVGRTHDDDDDDDDICYVHTHTHIKFSCDMVLLAEDERMLNNMLMEVNDGCEDYGMKISK